MSYFSPDDDVFDACDDDRHGARVMLRMLSNGRNGFCHDGNRCNDEYEDDAEDSMSGDDMDHHQ